MNEKLESAIKAVAEKAGKATNPDEAMKFAQAALNMTNALIGLAGIK